jgi:hypothetical protein
MFTFLILLVLSSFNECQGQIVSSSLRVLANSRINNQFWSFTQVSYNNGVLYAHNLPIDATTRLTTPFKPNTGKGWSTTAKINNTEIIYNSENILNPYPFENILLVNEPLNIDKCSTYEKRRILASVLTCHQNNCFVTNSAHLQINIINPLLIYLYFVIENIKSMDEMTMQRINNIKLPLDNFLLLFTGGIEHSKALLLDFVMRFAGHVESTESYFAKLNDGQTHCFENIDVVVPSGRWNWDSMVYTMKGRWGTGDFYRYVTGQSKLIFDSNNICIV